tara:strand:+ start:105 stop:755 length:651 start_codon:yes stop_codon:yes gene_type:complete
MAADNGLLAPLAMFIIAGAYYFLSAQRIINEDFMDHSVRQMVGLMYLSDVGFNLVTAHLASKSEGKKKASKKSPELTGTPGLVLNLLPLTDLVGLVCAFEAIRLAGSGFHQTVGGASIPISCVLNVLITGKVFSTGQLIGISVVVLGLAVKAKTLLDSDAEFPAAATAYVLVVSLFFIFVQAIRLTSCFVNSRASATRFEASRWNTSATPAWTAGR